MVISAHANIIVYETYNDYVNDAGEEYDEIAKWTYGMTGKTSISLIQNGKKVKIPLEDIWGFKYGEVLFRIAKDENVMARVVSSGKITYYENGDAHLIMLIGGTNEAIFTQGYYCYVSKDLESEITPMPTKQLLGARKQINEFKEDYPEYSTLFDCIGKNYDYEHVRTCVENFEATP
jgi:hypothetical protein